MLLGLSLTAASVAHQASERLFVQDARQIDRPSGGTLCAHAADLDGDDDLDVVAGHGGGVAWYENKRYGVYSTPQSVIDGVDVWSLDTADLDLDGDLDIIAAMRVEGRISWFENRNGEFGDERVLATSAYYSQSVVADDLDGDGMADVVWGSRDHRMPVAWQRNLGDGEFSEPVVLASAVNTATGVVASDLDGDGDQDLVWASDSPARIVAWQENLGEGGFAEYRHIANSADSAVHIADLDLDGDVDVIANGPAGADGATRSVWYENVGDGEFAMRNLADDGPEHRNAWCSADFDGDGDRDVCSVSGNATAWYENLGDGAFTHRSVAADEAREAGTVEAPDLDGDGDADLLVASYYDGVLWFENQRHDAPSDGIAFAAAQPVADTGGANSVALADLDGDGQTDVVWVGRARAGVAWARNVGRGFDRPVYLEGVGLSDVVHIADLDGDGDPDVLVGSLRWYRNLGGGTLSAPIPIVDESAARDVAVVDLDGDGDLEPLYVTVDEVVYHDNLGGGDFGDPVVIAAGLDDPRSVAGADVDTDGDLDFVIGSRSERAFAWYENAEGGFVEHFVTDEGWGDYAMAVGDIDGDGDPDVLTTRHAWISWHENHDRGALWETNVLGEGASGPAHAFDLVDMDGDGDTDVVSVANHVEWYENLGGVFATHTIAVTEHGTSNVAAADMDGDGDIDIVYASPERPGVLWHENLTRSAPLAAPSITTTRAAFGRVEVAWLPVAPEDAGSAPILRYVVRASSPSAPERQCIARAHEHRCVVAGLIPGATYELSVRAESAAGPGPSSTPVSVMLPSLVRGALAFSSAQTLTTDFPGAVSVDAADFDRDGDLDVVAASNYGGEIAWHENLGTGSFSEGRTISDAVSGVEDVHAADLDGDGDTDLLSASWNDDTIAWLENDGSADFSVPQTITSRADGPRGVDVADLDLDGDLDVLSVSALDDKVAWYVNQGGGSFSVERVIADDADFATSVGTADFDADGDPDLVVAAEFAGEIRYYRNDGDGDFALALVADGVENPLFVDAADVDGDGDPDVVATSIGDHRVRWYENLGNGVFGAGRLISTSQVSPWRVRTADLNGDGNTDVLVASKGDATVAWYESLGVVSTAPVMSPGNVRAVAGLDTIAVSWERIPAAADGGAPVVRYLVEAVPEIGSETVTCTATAADYACVVEGLTAGVEYSVTVRAVNELAEGPATDVVTRRAVCRQAGSGAPTAAGNDTVAILESPATASGEPRKPARSAFVWSSSAAQSYSIVVDDDAAFACPSSGRAGDGEEVETTLVALCPASGERDIGVDVVGEGRSVEATWTVRCTDGNALVLAVEHYQGPMARVWRGSEGETDGKWDVHTPTLAGRRAVLVARVRHDSPAVPGVWVGINDAAGDELADGLATLADSRTTPPADSASNFWETEHVFDLAGELYRPDNRTRFQVDPEDLVQETDESDNTTDLDISVEELPAFKIVFVPMRSGAGEPATTEAATYMKHIYDFFPIADGYSAEVGDTFEFSEDSWDLHDATTELLHAWNTDADGDEYWQGIFKHPWDGSACGYAFLDSHVSVAAQVHDGCTPNINVHEVGHNLNLRHPRDGCGAGNANPDYPYDDSGIGPRRGWLFSSGIFVNPDDGFADTMSYCGPRYFISDYHYRAVFEYRRGEDSDDAVAAASQRHPVAGDPVAHAAGREDADGEGDRASTPSSIAVTGVIDPWGNWSVHRATTSLKSPRRPARIDDGYEIVLVDALGVETHREAVALYAGSDDDGSAAWAVRMPMLDQPPSYIVVRDHQGRVVLEHNVQGLAEADPRQRSSP